MKSFKRCILVAFTLALVMTALAASTAFAAQTTPASSDAVKQSAAQQAAAEQNAAQQAASQKSATTTQESAAAASSKATAQSDTSAATSSASSSAAGATKTKKCPVANGVYTIASAVDKTKKLNVVNSSKKNAATTEVKTHNPTPSQRWKFTAYTDGTCKIANVGSGKVLAVDKKNLKRGAAVRQTTWSNTASKRWRPVAVAKNTYVFYSALSNTLVLDLKGGTADDGTRARLWKFNGTKAQKWKLVSTYTIIQGCYTIKNGNSKKMLNVANGSMKSKAAVQQFLPNSSRAQQFYLAYSDTTGYYSITNIGSFKSLGTGNVNAGSGTRLRQYTRSNSYAQRWDVSVTIGGKRYIRNANTGLFVDIEGASQNSNANARVSNASGSSAQIWAFRMVGDIVPEDTYTIKSLLNTSNSVDAETSNANSDASVQVAATKNNRYQQWIIKRVTGDIFTFYNVGAGKYLSYTGISEGAGVRLGTKASRWRITFTMTGFYLSPNKSTKYVIDIPGASKESGVGLLIWSKTKGANQRFAITPRTAYSGAENIARLAAAVAPTAYPMDETRIKDSDGWPYTWNNDSRLDAYRALAEAVQANSPKHKGKYASWSSGTYDNWAWASCHQAACIIIRAAVDEDMPMDNPTVAAPYFNSHPEKWQYVGHTSNANDSMLQPGDVLNVNNHTMIYVGNKIAREYHPGTTGLIFEASYSGGSAWYPGITATGTSGSFWADFSVYRFVGTPNGAVNASDYL